MSAPFEIVAAPLTLWIADINTAAPAIDAAPDTDWFLIGSSGDKNYNEDGLSVTHGQTITPFTPVGATTPRKVWRTEESFMIACNLVDLTPEQYAKMMNDAAITTVAAGVGVAGSKKFALFQGIQVATFALLARGLSPVDESQNAQYYNPVVYQGSAALAPVYKKGDPATLALEFHALSGDTGDFGDWEAGTAPAT